MNWVKRIVNRRQMDEQLDKELSFHLDTLTADLIAQGVDPAEARRQARLSFGGVSQVSEITRDARGTRWVEDLLHDLRYALRTLRQRPGFAAVALLTLALGTGATTVMFTVIRGVLLEPLSFPDSGRVLALRETSERFGDRPVFAYPNFLDMQRDSHTMSLAASRYGGGTISAPGQAAYVDGLQISAGMFQTLGIPLVRGREFFADEDRRGGASVAIISHNIWQSRFGGNDSALGADLQFDGRQYTVVGIAPAGFQLAGPAEVYTPLGQVSAPFMRNRQARPGIRVIGRLAPNISLAAANIEAQAISGRLAEQYPEANRGIGVAARPLLEDVVQPVQSTLWMLLGAVGIVLLIACVNVASLLLARAVSRQRELAMRVALGAGRGRLIRQCLAESALLSLLGGMLGVFLAYFSIEPFLTLWPGTLPRAEGVQLDLRVLAASLVISLICGLLFGLAPALRVPTRNLEQTLRGGSRGTGGGSRRLHGIFVAAEVALAVVLLVSAGILGSTLLRLSYLNPGVKLENALVVRVAISPGSMTRIRAAWDEVLETARRTPGLQSAALADSIPMRSGENPLPYSTTAASAPADQLPVTIASSVTPDYLKVMGIPLLHGRFLDDRDGIDAPPVAVIDEVMAQHAFHRTDVVGERLWVAALGPTPVTIVGVVGHVRHWGLATDDQALLRDQLYYPFAQLPDFLMRSFASLVSMAVRTTGDPLTVVEPLQRELRGLAGDLVLYEPRSLEQLSSSSIARQRFLMLLFGVFASLALVLASIGVYGVLAYLISQRVPEFGVRVALGASTAHVMGLVFRQSFLMVGAGAAIGLAGSFAAARLLEQVVAGAQPTSLSTFAAMTGVLLIAALVASFGPARRASRLDPLVALRQD